MDDMRRQALEQAVRACSNCGPANVEKYAREFYAFLRYASVPAIKKAAKSRKKRK